MNTYMYKFKCEKWYGFKEGLRNIHAENNTDEIDVEELARNDAKSFANSGNCDVALLQKFFVTVKPVKNYAALASIPFTVNNNESINN